MGTTNLGNQYITFRYRHPAKAQDFNTLLRGGIQAGIYEGANVTIESANTISISPFIAYINVGNDKTIKIQTFLPITLTVNESTPVIYLMYEWQNVINNYVDVLQRARGSQPIENEVCVCECIFTNGSITGIDYSVRNYGKQIQIPIDENLPPIITNSQIKVNNLNADLLDGKHASSSPTANTIPVADGMGKLNNEWLPTLPMCYVRMNADQNISPYVWTKMQFSNKILDPYNNFNTNTFNFVAPSPGYYFVTACFAINSPGAPAYQRKIAIAKNDDLITHNAANDGPFGWIAGATCNVILYLNTNEHVSAYLLAGSDATIVAEDCGFAVMRIR